MCEYGLLSLATSDLSSLVTKGKTMVYDTHTITSQSKLYNLTHAFMLAQQKSEERLPHKIPELVRPPATFTTIIISNN